MPLRDDDEICFCFHVPLRKIRNFCRVEKPLHASQISQCLSAGTGCGWCRPMLRKIHRELCGSHQPWWRQMDAPAEDYSSPQRDADSTAIDAGDYAQGRAEYLRLTGRKPPQPPQSPSTDGQSTED